jgi:anion-transporting  ArsA/GET3 family ATPase
MNSSAHEHLPLTIFCGKGGVGKTSMALAFALRHATEGMPVLVVTSHPLRELAVSVSLAGLKESYPRAAANLFIVHIDALDLLAKKVKQVVPSELLVKKVLASPIYKSLIEIAPGLKEIVFLARLHELAQQRDESPNPIQFRLVIWDAPATGHFLQMMKVSQEFETYLSGPFALLGREVSRFFSDASNLALKPVSALEEMAVDETIELCETLQNDLKLRPDTLIANMASPLLGSPEAEFEHLREDTLKAGSPDLKFIFDHHQIERSLLKKLQSGIGAKIQIVRRMPSWSSDIELLMHLAGQLGGVRT